MMGQHFLVTKQHKNPVLLMVHLQRVTQLLQRSKAPKITLLSGFVSYQMVRDEYGAGRSGFGSLLSLGHSPGKTDKLYLKCPGGRGEVEVAVSGVADQSKHDLNNHPPRHKEVRFGTIVKTAASVAAHSSFFQPEF